MLNFFVCVALLNFLTSAVSVDPKTIYFPDDNDEGEEFTGQEQASKDDIISPSGTNEANFLVTDADQQLKTCESRLLEVKNTFDSYEARLFENQKQIEDYKLLLAENKLLKTLLLEIKNNVDKYETCLTENRMHVKKNELLLTDNTNLCGLYLNFLSEVVKHAKKYSSFQIITLDFMLTESDLYEIQNMLSIKSCKNEIQIFPAIESWIPYEHKLVISMFVSVTIIIFLLFLHAIVFKLFILIFIQSVKKVITLCGKCQTQFSKLTTFLTRRIALLFQLKNQDKKINTLSDKILALHETNKVEASSKVSADVGPLKDADESSTERRDLNSQQYSSETSYKILGDRIEDIPNLDLNPPEKRKNNN